MKPEGDLAPSGEARPYSSVSPTVAIHGLFILFGVVIAAFFPFFALFLAERGLSPDQIGIVLAVMALARVVANPVAGHLADARLGRRRAFQLSEAGAALGAVWLFLAGNALGWVLAAAAVLAALASGSGPNLDALALDHLGQENLSDYGRIRAWESLSYAVACVALGYLLQAEGIRLTMLAYAAGSVAVGVWAWTLRADPPRHSAGQGHLGTVGAVFREAPRFWGYLAGALLLWTGFSGAWNFISLRIASAGGGPLLVGLGAALGGAVEVPVMRLSSRLHRRVGLRTTYAAGCAVYATGFLLWGMVKSPVILALLTVFEGVGFALLFTSGVVIVGNLVPPSLRSTGQSISTMIAFGIGPILGGAAGGFAYEHLGARTLYGIASILALAGGVVVWGSLTGAAFRRPPAAEADPADPAAAPPPDPRA